MPDSPRKGSLLVIFLTVFIDLLGFGMVMPLLPLYANEFQQDEHGWQLGVLMASFSAMQFFFAPIWGRVSDRIGRRPVLMLGLTGSIVFYSLFGVATIMKSYWLLLLTRIGAGIAGATIPTAQAYIADTTSLENRPKGMALIGMAFGLGFTFGPLLGFLAAPREDADPGPWPGYAAAILSAGALALAVFHLPESRHAKSESAGRKWLDLEGLRAAIAAPSIGMLLVAIFVCVFSFANFESTLSLLIKGQKEVAQDQREDGAPNQVVASRASESRASASRGQDETPGEQQPVAGPKQRKTVASPFHFDWGSVCLTYAYIGFMLAIIQGGIVRRLAGRVPEGTVASSGALIQAVGFGLVAAAIGAASAVLLFVALAVVVLGFSMMQTNLQSLLSRRSDPAKQGVVLGFGQSVNSLARIIGPLLGIPMLRLQLGLPYYLAAGMMAVGFALVVAANRAGRDYAPVGLGK